jgi:hypothetical protein
MKGRLAISVLALGLAAAAPALAQQRLLPGGECIHPSPVPIIPDGSFASRMQMQGARMDVWRFSSASHDYRECLQHALVAAKGQVSPAQKQHWLAAIRASFDEERMLRQELQMQIMRQQMRF